jgi:hypothetical protein
MTNAKILTPLALSLVPTAGAPTIFPQTRRTSPSVATSVTDSQARIVVMRAKTFTSTSGSTATHQSKAHRGLLSLQALA